MKIKQIVITGQNNAELQDRELDTSVLGEHDVLVETERSFISAGTELAIYTGTDENVFIPGRWCTYPYTSGYANVGRVQAVGTGVEHFAVGDRIFSCGRHASHHIVPTKGGSVAAKVPEGVSVEEAAASRMAQVAMTGIDIVSPGHHRYVVVFGLGAVGNLAAQMFQIIGSTVIGVDPSPVRRELALQCGIAHAIGGTEEEVHAQISEITGGRMAKVSVDAVGHSAVSLQCIGVTASFGEVIVLGTPRVPVEGNLTDVFATSHFRWITIKGALEWRLPTYPQMPHEHSQLGKHEAIMAWLGDGRLKVAPLISHSMPPSAITEAYEGLLNKKDEFSGVILDWSGGV